MPASGDKSLRNISLCTCSDIVDARSLRVARGDTRTAHGAGAGSLAVETCAHDRTVCARRPDRRCGTPVDAKARRDPRPAGLRRESRRRNRDHRLGGGRAGGARRLHADNGDDRHACNQFQPLRQAVVRSGKGFCRDHAHGGISEPDPGACVGAGKKHPGADRARQGAARQACLCVVRKPHLAQRRSFHEHGRHRHAQRAPLVGWGP